MKTISNVLKVIKKITSVQNLVEVLKSLNIMLSLLCIGSAHIQVWQQLTL